MLFTLNRWLISLWGLSMLLLGFTMMFHPSIIIQHYSLRPVDAMGWSALSGNFSALILLLGISALGGAWRNDRLLLWNVIFMEAVILIGRVIGIWQHGFIEPMSFLIAAEVAIAMLIFVHIYRIE